MPHTYCYDSCLLDSKENNTIASFWMKLPVKHWWMWGRSSVMFWYTSLWLCRHVWYLVIPGGTTCLNMDIMLENWYQNGTPKHWQYIQGKHTPFIYIYFTFWENTPFSKFLYILLALFTYSHARVVGVEGLKKHPFSPVFFLVKHNITAS